jgi:tetratricopeptide (TPR) repeat protein
MAENDKGTTRLLRELIFGPRVDGREPADAPAEPMIAPSEGSSLDDLAGQIDEALRGRPAAKTAVLDLIADAYRRRADSGDVTALLQLGDLLESTDQDSAKTAYKLAAEAGQARGLLGLGRVLSRQSHQADAEATVREAVASGDPDAVPGGLILLAEFLQRSDRSAAEDALRQAAQTGHPRWATAALVDLGHMLAYDGDGPAARAAFEQAVNASAGDRQRTANALYSMASMLDVHGEPTEAQAAWRRVFETGDPNVAAQAMEALLTYLRQDADINAVRALHQEAVATGNSAAPEALVTIAEILEARGDTAGARAAVQQALDDGHPETDRLLEWLNPSRPPTDAERAALPSELNPRNMACTGAEMLDHGLPRLPAELSYQMAIPLAFWAAEHSGVALFLTFRRYGRSQRAVENQLTYHRTPDGWQADPLVLGVGTTLDPIARPDDQPELGGNAMTGSVSVQSENPIPGQLAAIASGGVAPPVTHVALVQDGRTDTRQLQSHLGVWVVCTESPSPFQVHGLDKDGAIVASISHAIPATQRP